MIRVFLEGHLCLHIALALHCPLLIAKKMFSATTFRFVNHYQSWFTQPHSQDHPLLFFISFFSQYTLMVRVEIAHWLFLSQKKVSLEAETFKMASSWMTTYQIPFIKMIHITLLFHIFTPQQFLHPGCVELILLPSCSITKMLNPASCISALNSQQGTVRL